MVVNFYILKKTGYNTMLDMLAWMRTGSNPPDSNWFELNLKK